MVKGKGKFANLKSLFLIILMQRNQKQQGEIHRNENEITTRVDLDYT